MAFCPGLHQEIGNSVHGRLFITHPLLGCGEMPAPQGFHLQRPTLQEQITDSSGGTDEDTTFYQKQNTLECWIFLLNRGYRKLEREAKGLKKLSHIFMPFYLQMMSISDLAMKCTHLVGTQSNHFLCLKIHPGTQHIFPGIQTQTSDSLWKTPG